MVPQSSTQRPMKLQHSRHTRSSQLLRYVHKQRGNVACGRRRQALSVALVQLSLFFLRPQQPKKKPPPSPQSIFFLKYHPQFKKLMKLQRRQIRLRLLHAVVSADADVLHLPGCRVFWITKQAMLARQYSWHSVDFNSHLLPLPFTQGIHCIFRSRCRDPRHFARRTRLGQLSGFAHPRATGRRCPFRAWSK